MEQRITSFEEEMKKLMDQILPPQGKGLNLHLFSGAEHGSQEIIQTAQTLPMFSPYRFVLVRKADQMDEEEVERILELYSKPLSVDLSCFLRSGSRALEETSGKDREGWKVIEYPRLKGKALVSWIKKRMEEKGKTLSEDAANYLVEVVGDHLQDLDNTLETIFLSTGDKRMIGLSDIEGILSDIKVSTIFELTDAIGQQNLEKALGILRKGVRFKGPYV